MDTPLFSVLVASSESILYKAKELFFITMSSVPVREFHISRTARSPFHKGGTDDLL